ncbi:MAG TPA: TraB/GumN family protein [Flavobacteriaceae bacterium]|nr:TraB/GumN family protein [Flavobacteriaceae bacterium]
MLEKKSIHLFVLFFLLGMGIMFTGFAQDTTGQKHMLWKVSYQNEVQGYLAGSIHMVTPDFYPLDSVFYQTFAKSNPVVFELDKDKAKNDFAVVMDTAVYKKGDRLENHLSPELYIKTKQRLKMIPNIEILKPWLAAFFIKALNIMNEGNTMPGIDSHFHQKAKKDGKTIVGLETVEEQLKVFADLDEDQQVEFLKFNLKNKEDKEREEKNKMMNFWKTGNVKAVHKLLNSKNFNHLGNFSKELNKKLIIARNENWRKKLETMFKQNKKPMVIVGYGHLVGNHNLIEMLRQDGYTVEQM